MENWITPLNEVVDKIHNEKEFGEFDAMIVIAHQEGLKEEGKPNTTYGTYGKRAAVITNVYKYLADDEDLIKDFQIAVRLAATERGVRFTLRERIKMRLLARKFRKQDKK